MKILIKHILKEEFDWIKDVPGAPDGVTIGKPLSNSNPKSMFRVKWSHEQGEDGYNHVNDWINIKPNETDTLILYVRLLYELSMQEDPEDVIYELANRYINGEDWLLSDNAKNSLTSVLRRDGVDPEDVDLMNDYVLDYLRDELQDLSLIPYDSYYDRLASHVGYSVTYFDEFGVEHEVNIDVSKLSK